MAKQQSRSDRWSNAVSAAQAALEAINEAAQQLDMDAVETAASDFESAMQELADVKQEYQEWYDNMPESLQNSATGEKLATISDIDVEGANVYVDDIVSAIQEAIEEVLSEATDALSEAESAELPVGFGRD